MGIDVNFCKTPGCINFGVPIAQNAQRGPGAVNAYTVVANNRGTPSARCNQCGEQFILKSNMGVAEEASRLHFEVVSRATCPDPLCGNHVVPVDAPKAYQSFGTTRIGSKRYRCKVCGITFSTKPPGFNPIGRQQQSDKNRTILSLLTNKMPLRRICEAANVTPSVLYERIDFFYEQSLAFLAARERAMGQTDFKRLYIGIDRQEYAVNWTHRKDKRNVVISAIASADNNSGYVFAMNTNFDPEMDPNMVEQAASSAGDHLVGLPHRRFARLWLQSDYDAAVASKQKRTSRGGLQSAIETTYVNASSRNDSEAGDPPAIEDKLPRKGMLVHSEYTLHGHFLLLRELLGSTAKVRFFLDQESGIRGACFGAFSDRILENRCDAFYIRIAKDLTVDEKRHRLNDAKAEFDREAVAMPGLTKNEVKLALLKQRIANAIALGPWKDRWVQHPLPTISEPEKALCYLTDFGQYDEDHLAWLYSKASLHAVDSFFNRLRRRFSMLERPVSPASNRGRTWYGYSAYRPEQIAKLLTIARACHNPIFLSSPS
ncbi:MAG: hypothetical protein NTX56_04200 [Proteobacteria bacterium]|nr:hypothetical protein [Pseudomonadota bacterium]